MHNSSLSLTVEQQKLLQQLMGSEGLVVPASHSIPRHKLQHPPLSYAQQRMWFLEQLVPGNAFYNTGIQARLKGSLNVAALEESDELMH